MLKRYLLFFLVAFSPVCIPAAVAGDRESAASLRAFIQAIDGYYAQFDQLLRAKAGIDRQRKLLTLENSRLSRERHELQRAKAAVAAGTVSQADHDRGWSSSGRKQKLDLSLKQFRQAVIDFNKSLKAYNSQVRGLLGFLKHRRMENVKAMMREMRKLRERLHSALEDGEVFKAEYIASQSRLAKELGYQPR